jgi:hypothetical protein
MTLRRISAIVYRVLTGVGSAWVTAYGVYAYTGANLSIDTVTMSLYCFLPMLSLPVFLLSFWRHRASVAAHFAMAFAYLISYSMLNWRTCAELGYCSTVAATVRETLVTRPVLITFAVALLNLLTLQLARRKSF